MTNPSRGLELSYQFKPIILDTKKKFGVDQEVFDRICSDIKIMLTRKPSELELRYVLNTEGLFDNNRSISKLARKLKRAFKGGLYGVTDFQSAWYGVITTRKSTRYLLVLFLRGKS